VDILYTNGGEKIAAEIKSGTNWSKITEIKDQLQRYANLKNSGIVDKIQFISEHTIPNEIKTFADNLGFEIIEGGIK